MNQFAARLFKQATQGVSRGKSERMVSSARPDPAPVLSSPTDVTGHRSARVLGLVLTLEALRAAPELIDGHGGR